MVGTIKKASEKQIMRISQYVTLIIGILAVVIAVNSEKVLNVILYAYGFMVAGLFVPTLGAYFWEKSSKAGAFGAMLSGGVLTILLQVKFISLPDKIEAIGLSPCFYGIIVSAIVFVSLSLWVRDR